MKFAITLLVALCLLGCAHTIPVKINRTIEIKTHRLGRKPPSRAEVFKSRVEAWGLLDSAGRARLLKYDSELRKEYREYLELKGFFDGKNE